MLQFVGPLKSWSWGAAMVVAVAQAQAVCFAGETYTQVPTIAASVDQTGTATEGEQQPTSDDDPFAAGPAAQWIWGDQPDGAYLLRKEVPGGAAAAQLIASCDNILELFINGEKVAQSSEWSRPVRVDATKKLTQEKNVITAKVKNAGGVSAFALKLVLTDADGKVSYIVSDKSWQAADVSEGERFGPVKTFGAMGKAPWGNVFTSTAAAPTDDFNVLPGFQVELLYTVPKDELGSWVSIAFDNKGRLIASDQGGKGLCRVTPPPIGSKEKTKVEHLDAKISASQGMLYAFGSLYVSVNGGQGSGLYRLRDTTGDDQYDEVVKLKALQGGGEHGPHALRLSPDGKSIYIIAGNHTDPPADFDSSRLPSNWSEDLLLPRQWDARGHARGKLAPGGWIAKTDPDGKTWEIVSSGYRNPYDMDFNADGELFAYDADMEWDLGSPWYRPTRVVHAVSGSEFGWRSGTGKWAEYFLDSVPPLVNIGPGSPVGAAFGYGAKFPAKYQNAFYICDWTFGTMYAIHIEPDGASYKAVKEEFVSRTPLPLTDTAVGPDGALYFTIGGRGAQSELYRVTYVGDADTTAVSGKNKASADLRELRQSLEALHHKADDSKKAVEIIWPNLGHQDRFIRYAARVALENQPVDAWQSRLFAEKDPLTLMNAAVALARQGDAGLQPKLMAALGKIDPASLEEDRLLDLLRTYALTFIRLGAPSAEVSDALSARFDPLYPAKSSALNRELSRVLVYLKSPTVIDKTLKLLQEEPNQSEPISTAELLARNGRYGGTIAQMHANQPDAQKIHYAFVLRNLTYGWTLEQRKTYFDWLTDARNRSGGASFQGFIDNIRKEALENATAAERAALASTAIPAPPKPEELPKAKGPGKKWSVADLVESAGSGLQGRNFENGQTMFAAARCVVCHRYAGVGGATGPDLTNVAGRFSVKDLSEAIVDPDKVISDQYRAHVIVTNQGKQYTGRLLNETKEKVTLLIDPEDANKVISLSPDDIDESTPSKISLMPKDLVNTLNQDELLDLIAFLLSRGNPNHRMFAK